MEMLKRMLKNREENQASITAKRLDRLWVKRQKGSRDSIQVLMFSRISIKSKKSKVS